MVVPAIGTGQAFIEECLSLSSREKEIRGKTIERLKNHIDFASQWGSLVIIGLIRGNLPPEGEEKEEALKYFEESLLKCSQLAKEKDVKLVIEPLNRYEINFLNTIKEALEFLSSLGDDNIGILADSFHMNIEEANFTRVSSRQEIVSGISILLIATAGRQGLAILILSLFFELCETSTIRFCFSRNSPKPNFPEAAKQTIDYLNKQARL